MKTFQGILLLLLVLLLLAGVPPAAWAQTTATFMQVPGIPGSAIEAHHIGWIDVLSLRQSWPISKDKSFCAVEVGKWLDIAGPRLWAAAVTGRQFPDNVVEIQRGGEGSAKLYELHLRDAQITAIVSSSAPGSFPSESVTITPTRMDVSFYPQNADGSVCHPITTSIACK